MENRFGIKDFFLFLLVIAAIVLIGLNMVQVDRQWQSIQALGATSDQHTRDLVEIKRALADGISVAAPAGPTSQSPAANSTQPNIQVASSDDLSKRDPFRVLKESEKMPGFARGDWFVDNLAAKVKGITPLIATDIPAAIIMNQIVQPLFYRDVDTLEFDPLLATDWDVSKDGKTISFQLRKGVSWSDGQPFTSADVKFTFDWIMNKAVNAPRDRSYMDKLVSVETKGDYQVIFKFSEYYFKSLETVGNENILCKHFYEKYTPEQYNDSVGLLIGTGPYRLDDPASWKPGVPIVLKRNEQYWGDPPPANRLLYLEIEEEAAEQTSFTNGDMDYWGCFPEQFEKLKADPRVQQMSQAIAYQNMVAGYSYISWNNKRDGKTTKFDDKAIRQALTMLIDRQQIVDKIFLGYGVIPHGSFAPGSKQADPDLKPWPFDPARAKKILADHGWYDRDGSGVISNEKGEPFRFALTYPSKSTTYDRIMLLVKDNLAAAGIQVDRDPEEWPLLQDNLQKHNFDAISLAWSGAVDDDPNQMFASSQMNDQGDNCGSYSNPEFDKALEAARSCVDDKKRNELWHGVDRIIADDCPYTFLIARKSTVFINNRWQNVRHSTMGLNRNLYDAAPQPWWVPADKQKYAQP
jgi:peptide/nickel transport system substrate-binding protein